MNADKSHRVHVEEHYAKVWTNEVNCIQRLGECTCTSYLPTSRQSCHSYLGHKFILNIDG